MAFLFNSNCSKDVVRLVLKRRRNTNNNAGNDLVMEQDPVDANDDGEQNHIDISQEDQIQDNDDDDDNEGQNDDNENDTQQENNSDSEQASDNRENVDQLWSDLNQLLDEAIEKIQVMPESLYTKLHYVIEKYEQHHRK